MSRYDKVDYMVKYRGPFVGYTLLESLPEGAGIESERGTLPNSVRWRGPFEGYR